MASPQSWDCPICLRHVPAKVAECYCGYRRSEPVAAASGPGSRALGAAGAVALLLGGVGAWLLQAPPPPPPTLVPAPVGAPTRPSPARASTPTASPSATMPDAWKALAIETTPAPVAPPAVGPTPSPSPTPDESVDAQRVKGVAAFEAALAGFADRIADFHEKLRRYDAQCEATNTTVTGCDGARNELRSVAQAIADDVEAADDQARRSWVDPGQRRALRERAGVDENAIRDVLKAASDAARR